MDIKLQDFMKNPQGKGANMPGRDMLLANLDYRFERMRDKIKMNIYTDKQVVYYHIIIPTEAEDRTNDYDVLIKFKPSDPACLIDKSYKHYFVEFFSNCPSFTYTYAYVAKLNGYLIPELFNKYEEITLSNPPTSRNPGVVFGYEKSIYYASKYILSDKQFMLKSYTKTYGQKLTPNILESIRNTSVIEEEIKRSKNVEREKRLQEKRPKKERSDQTITSHSNVKRKSNVNVIKKTQPKKSAIKKVKPIKKR